MCLSFKKIICGLLLLSLLLSFSACKKSGEAFSSVADAPEESTPFEDGGYDPENTEIFGESGAEVKLEGLEAKQGAANGIDASKWQGKINWSAVKSAGIDFAIIRIGFRGENGRIYKDDYADYNLQQAEKAGVLTGVYFFSTATSTDEALEEAKWTVNAVEGYSISYPVVYDCEGFLNSESRMHGITNAQRTDNALAFLRCVSESGYEGMLYSAKSELENSKHWDTARIEGEFKIWLARYTAVPYPQTAHPDYSGSYDMWQYTDKGTVSGIAGNVDLSVSYFTRQKAEPKNKKLRPRDSSAPEVKDTLYTDVGDTVTPKIEVNLRESATARAGIVATVKNGTLLTRTGVGANGWSRISYNGKTVFAITSYLTEDTAYKPPESTVSQAVDDGFTPADGQVTAKEETNLRLEPSAAAPLAGTIKNGEFVTRTGVNPNGWTRISYNGQTVYAKTSLLTTEVITPKEPEPDDGFEPASGRYTAKSETNLRTLPTTKEASSVVYTLKRGEFVERTGYNPATRWASFSYNGQTVYAIASYLLSEEEYNAQQSAE